MALLCEQKRRDIHVDGELLLQIKAICQLPIGLMEKKTFSVKRSAEKSEHSCRMKKFAKNNNCSAHNALDSSQISARIRWSTE